ncbi:MAG: hypothetical protein OEU36_13130 [Gammaproteobacteria bacterium]|nr:hypothetical protein [Gammaproteobacteria bacterium]
MLSLVKSFVGISLFRSKPQDLPGSASLVWATAIAGILIRTLVDRSEGPLSTIFAISAVQVITFGAVVWLILRMMGLSERWNQTISALYGTDCLVRLVGWPAISRFYSIKHQIDLSISTQAPLPPEAATPTLLLFVLAFWTIAIMTFVLRHALEKSIGVSLIITLACQFASSGIVLWLFFGQMAQET